MRTAASNVDDDEMMNVEGGRSQRIARSAVVYYYCGDCGQEFRRKERVCSCCGSRDIRRGER